jgi:hypothetical protein
METILVWVLVTTARMHGWDDAMPTYSPYIATLEDCTRLLNSITGDGVYKRQCVQIRVLVKE